MALRPIATAATILCLTIPVRAHGQTAAKTACNDGTTTTATGARACDGHGGIHSVHSTILHRGPSGTQQQPGRITQAGTPEATHDNSDRAEPEEHRGWRWSHRHDDRADDRAEERRREEERRRAEERRAKEKREHRSARVRCRDGKYEHAKNNHGNGRGPDVCKHHGGVAD